MEDSGFDSGDVKLEESDEKTPINQSPDYRTSPQDSDSNGVITKPSRSTALLQKRIEKRIEQAKKSQANGTVDQQPRKSLIAINRLNVPNKLNIPLRDGAEQPLVMWQSDSSEDEYEFLPAMAHHTHKEISKQLQKDKDGYDLDLTPDDEDLDLIPPRAFNQNCICCRWSTTTCSIQ